MSTVIRLESAESPLFATVAAWYRGWLGEKYGESAEEISRTFAHSVNTERLPQTFVALEGGQPAGMYQLAVADDLFTRPDLYPWLINAYVAPAFRGRGVFRAMMESVPANARRAELTELYLYTEHEGLYEKFGWRFLETAALFRPEPLAVRVYRLSVPR